MRKFILILMLVIALVAVISWYWLSNNTTVPATMTTTTSTPVPSKRAEPTDFTASFEIYTNGTKRIFTQAMYHQQSPDVFIQNPDPSIVYVKKGGITWAEFFNTLPFSLTKDCLVTGTKQTFCTNEQQKLQFFLNTKENPDALDMEIQPKDHLRVTYGN